MPLPMSQRTRTLPPVFFTSWLLMPSCETLASSKPATRLLVPGWMMLARKTRAEPFRSRVCTLNSTL